MSAREQRAAQAVKELRRYAKLKVRIESLQDRLEMLDAEMHGIKSGIGGESVKSGGGNNRLDALIDQKTKVQDDINSCTAQITITERAIDALEQDERKCIERFFFENLNANEAARLLAEELVIDERNVWRLRQRSLMDYAELAGITICQ